MKVYKLILTITVNLIVITYAVGQTDEKCLSSYSWLKPKHTESELTFAKDTLTLIAETNYSEVESNGLSWDHESWGFNFNTKRFGSSCMSSQPDSVITVDLRLEGQWSVNDSSELTLTWKEIETPQFYQIIECNYMRLSLIKIKN